MKQMHIVSARLGSAVLLEPAVLPEREDYGSNSTSQ